MQHVCPGCQRAFDEPGFCPFDRTQLVPMSDARTIVTGPMRAVSGPHTTTIERRGTFPLTPSPSAQGSAAGPPTAPTSPMPAPAPPVIPPSAAAASAAAAARTDAITAARQRPAPETPADLAPIRAVSASENPREALESYQDARDSDYDKLVGQTLDGRYIVQKKIGEGGMGVVFAARHAVIERPLAIKVLKREVMRDTATIRRFVQEAKAASRIGHPNIVDVTDFGTTPDGMTYSVMEYVAGQTLGTAIRHGAPFAMPRAARIAAQIARALGAAHDKGIIHRDLKPENVFLLDRDGRPDFVKIVDFGIAKVTPAGGHNPNEPRLTRAGSVFGTPEYMAPEQAAGRGDTDGRVDIYALGVILYEMVTGRVPHKGDSMVRTLAMQMLDPVEPPRKLRPDLDLSAELEGVILKALAKKREQRYQTMGELLAAVDKLQTPVGVSVTGSPVYALVPLPPGADPSLGPASPAAPLGPIPHAASGPLPGAAASGPLPGAAASGPLPGAAASGPHAGAGIPAAPILAANQPSAPILLPIPITPVPGDASGAVPVPPHPGSSFSGRARTPTGPAGHTQRRLKDEPEFVTHERPITFEHVFTEESAAPRRRVWPYMLLVAALLGAGGGAIALVMKGRGRAIATAPADAGLPQVPPRVDAAIAQAPDAGSPDELPPPDAAVVVAAELPDGGVRIALRPRDAGIAVATAPPDRRTVEIQVLTKPEGATLYVGTEYRGPGGANLREAFGTKYEVTCKHPGYKNGVVKLVFDGKRHAELCVLERIVVCIPGVKNPFDECPD